MVVFEQACLHLDFKYKARYPYIQTPPTYIHIYIHIDTHFHENLAIDLSLRQQTEFLHILCQLRFR